MADEKAPQDRALELFVYAPVGVALYVRDMLPMMMGVFVSRGKREVQSHLPGQVPTPPMPTPPSPPSPADVRRRIEEGLGLARIFTEQGITVAREVAGSGLGFARDVAGNAVSGVSGMPGMPGSAAPAAPPDASWSAPSPSAPAPPGRPQPTTTAPAPAPSDTAEAADGPAPDVPDVASLAIPDYDELSASQVVERLEGLDAASLDAIRRYESAHRGRNTILGKIAQLS